MTGFYCCAGPGVLVAFLVLAACGGSKTGTPSPPNAGSGDVVQITGRERFGWTQSADSIAGYNFAVYVDNSRVELPAASCRAASAATFDCDSPLPPLSAGRHTLEVVAWVSANGQVLESPKAAALNVNVMASVAPVEQVATTAPAPSSSIAASPAKPLSTGCGLTPLSETAFLMWDETGEIRAIDRRTQQSRPLAWDASVDGQWRLSGAARDPRFDENRWIYLAELRADADATRLRLSRHRDVADVLGERIVLLDTPLRSHPARTALSFGPDDRLYIALLADAATVDTTDRYRFLIRLNADGSVPADNDARSIFATPLAARPVAFAWDAAEGRPWIAERESATSYLLRTPGRTLPVSERLSGSAPPVMLRFTSADGGQRLVVVDAKGSVRALNRLGNRWTVQATTTLFSTDHIVRDALAFDDGEIAACGAVEESPAVRYGVWRGKSPL